MKVVGLVGLLLALQNTASPGTVDTFRETTLIAADTFEHDPLFFTTARNVAGYDYKIPIRFSEYIRYGVRGHHVENFEYDMFVTAQDPVIRRVSRSLTSHIPRNEDKAQALLDFVNQHIYDKSIEPAADYVRFPVETLVHRNGDCEDLAILAGALIKSQGLNVALLHFTADQLKERAGHVALGVQGEFVGTAFELNGQKYFYAEAIGTAVPSSPSTWRIGEVPARYKGITPRIIPLP